MQRRSSAVEQRDHDWHRSAPPLLVLLAVSACGQATQEGALTIPDNQALLSIGQEAGTGFPLPQVQLGLRSFTEDCSTALCFYWHDAEEKAYFELTVPRMSGTLPLSDSSVQLSYELAGQSIPLQICPQCTGTVAIAGDAIPQSLHVTVDGIIGMRSICKVRYCEMFEDADAFTVKVTPCDGGTCFSDIPCSRDGTVHIDDPSEQFCSNPDYQSLPVTVKARVTLNG